MKHSGTAFDVGPAFNAYGYNARSEVTSADRYWGSDLGITTNPVLGQDYDYAYDNIGNRTSSARGTNAMTYTANSLNQYSQRTIPDGFDVLGSAETNTTVTVNNLATTRFAKYWYRALTGTNTSAADYHAVNVVGVYNPPGTNDPDVVTTSAGHVFVAKTPEAFTYDSDGNLLSDGRFAYTWDAENRLVSAQTLTNLPSSVPRKRVEFTYDYMSRRVSKTVYSGLTNNNYQATNNSSFLYNGWNLVSELITDNGSLITNSYIWGLDLSGSLSAAGGIGGLIAANIGTNSVVYSYDANGNVSDLVDSQSGSIVAHYEFSPFGETIVATGPLAKANPFRFSTKYFVDELSMGDWGYRWYGPSIARWLSRDPLGEEGGRNLFAFTYNRPISLFDRDGRIVVFEGDDADIKAAEAGWQKAEEMANEEYKKKISEINNDFRVCKIMVTRDTKTEIGYFPTGTIDIGDINKFPDTGAVTKTSVLSHEVFEQYEKQVNCEEVYQPAHTEGVNAEVGVGGWTRTGKGLPIKNPDGSVTLTLYYENKIVVDKDGKKTTETKKAIVKITYQNGNIINLEEISQ